MCTWPVAPLGEAKWLWRFSCFRNNRQQRFISSGKKRHTNADIIIIKYDRFHSFNFNNSTHTGVVVSSSSSSPSPSSSFFLLSSSFFLLFLLLLFLLLLYRPAVQARMYKKSQRKLINKRWRKKCYKWVDIQMRHFLESKQIKGECIVLSKPCDCTSSVL